MSAPQPDTAPLPGKISSYLVAAQAAAKRETVAEFQCRHRSAARSHSDYSRQEIDQTDLSQLRPQAGPRCVLPEIAFRYAVYAASDAQTPVRALSLRAILSRS